MDKPDGVSTRAYLNGTVRKLAIDDGRMSKTPLGYVRYTAASHTEKTELWGSTS